MLLCHDGVLEQWASCKPCFKARFDSYMTYLTVWSKEPETMVLPTMATHLAEPVCPVSVLSRGDQSSSLVSSWAHGWTGSCFACWLTMVLEGASHANCRAALQYTSKAYIWYKRRRMLVDSRRHSGNKAAAATATPMRVGSYISYRITRIETWTKWNWKTPCHEVGSNAEPPSLRTFLLILSLGNFAKHKQIKRNKEVLSSLLSWLYSWSTPHCCCCPHCCCHCPLHH